MTSHGSKINTLNDWLTCQIGILIFKLTSLKPKYSIAGPGSLVCGANLIKKPDTASQRHVCQANSRGSESGANWQKSQQDQMWQHLANHYVSKVLGILTTPILLFA